MDVVAGGTVTGIHFGSFVPPPPPPPPVIIDVNDWQSAASTKRDLVIVATPACPVASITATVGYVFGGSDTQAMALVSGNRYETTFTAPFIGGLGYLIVNVTCTNGTTVAFSKYLYFIDPSGTILDGCTGGPLAGATVTVLKNEPYGSDTYVVPDQPEHIPSENPELTEADGVYAWDVVPGRWRVRAAKPGYDTVVTDPFDVPPPKLNLDITLMPTAGCNVAPAAKDDAYGVDRATFTVAAPGVLANDGDADGDVLTAQLVAGAAHGHVALGSNGSFAYTPNAGFSGSDTFTYKASDGVADSNVATVTLTVKKVNRPPMAKNDAYRTKKNRPFLIGAPGVLANDADPEGSALKLALARHPAHGFVLLFPSGAFAYLPKPGFVGTDTFTYRASDGVNSSNTATVTVEVSKPERGRGGHDRDHDDEHDHEDDGR